MKIRITLKITGEMLRSRFFPITCSCLKSADQLYEICRDISIYALERLGQGHSEKVYENFLIQELYKRRIPCLRQVKYYSEIDGNVYETGIVDIEVDQKLILELKAGAPCISSEHKTQAKRYLKSAREKFPDDVLLACVILWSKTGDVKFWKCTSTPSVSRMDVEIQNSDNIPRIESGDIFETQAYHYNHADLGE